jgi:uncharacterized protein YndB with AHSA1/START domain
MRYYDDVTDDLRRIEVTLQLAPGERLRYTSVFDDPNLPGEMVTTVDIKPVSVGVGLNIVQEGIPEAIAPEACSLGWQESLEQFARLVDPEQEKVGVPVKGNLARV